MQNLVVGATNVVRLRRLRNEVTKVFLVDAVVTGTLYDTDDVAVTDAIDLFLAYVQGTPRDGSGDEYRATIPHTAPLAVDATYTFIATAIATDGSQRIFHEDCIGIEG